jgi:hypothetical protein
VVAACIASSRDLTLFDYKKNKIDIQGVSHNVFYQNVLQVKANANFNVNDFV